MKKIIINNVIILAGILITQTTQAQGTVYVSSLGQSATSSFSIGSDSWLAVDFRTGTNSSGYILNSIQLGITNASGNPSGFTAMIYSAISGAGITPGNNLETLNGSANPSLTGVYTYNDVSNLTLLPQTTYFVVLTSGTAIASGAYEWSVSSTFSPNLINGWQGDSHFRNSINGSSWNSITDNYPLFALNAMPIPEPASLFLFGLSSLLFFRHRRRF